MGSDLDILIVMGL